MRPLDLSILILASIANLCIGLFSYLKNYRNLTHKIFAILTVTLVGWTSANFISIAATDPNHIFLAVKAVLLFVVLQNTCFLLFVSVYPGNTIYLSKRILKFYLTLSFITLFLGFFPGFFKGYVISGNSINPQASPVIAFFMVHTTISIGGGIARLMQRYIHSKGLARNRFQFLLLASGVLLLIAPFTNFILPVAFGIRFFIAIGPLYTLAFASLIAYSMVKHSLLDFRALVAKAFAYILSISFIALIYSVFIFGILALFLGNQDIALGIRAVYVLIAVVLAFSFQSIKHFFDRVTNRFFFKDSYDTQVFLNDLNRVLVSTIELEILLRQSLEIIEKNLKPEFGAFSIRKTDNTSSAVVGTGKQPLDQQDFEHIQDVAANVNQNIIITDDLENTPAALKSALGKRNIAVMVRLSSSVGNRDGLGCLALGYKKSGNSYNSQDIRNIDIVANELVIAIQNALRFEEIQAFNATLQEKINVATHRLRQINEKLRVLDETKDEFISMASHQLRTPLTSIKGYLSMVLDGDAGKLNQKQRQFIDQAYLSSQRMVYLIADLLNVSRLKTGKFVLEQTPTDLGHLIAGELKQLSAVAASRRIELAFARPPVFPVLMLDEIKIRQVVMNFADNALYYTPPGGRIRLELEEKPASVELRVIDNGIGVPRAEQHQLFNKFYRAGNARRMRPDGTGLGLFMARKVITAHGGAILFSSQEGRGSLFGFTLPKTRPT